MKEAKKKMQIVIITSVATLAVLALVTITMVLKYQREHAQEIRQGLLAKAEKYGVEGAAQLENRELAEQIREAKRAAKQSAAQEKVRTA